MTGNNNSLIEKTCIASFSSSAPSNDRFELDTLTIHSTVSTSVTDNVEEQHVEEGRDKGPVTFSIATFNVNWGLCLMGFESRRTRTVLDAILQSDADVVCLQETHPGWEIYFTKHLDEKYPYRIWCHHTNQNINRHLKIPSSAGGMSVLSKFAINEICNVKPSVNGSMFPFLFFAVSIPNQKPLFVANVHLRPPIGSDHSLSLISLFSSKKIRKEELKCILQNLCIVSPDVICGDYNEGYKGGGIHSIIRKYGYTDALPLFNKTQHTWKWPLKLGISLKAAYDHIVFDPKRLNVLDTKAYSKYAGAGSDHAPVVGKFQLLPELTNYNKKISNFIKARPKMSFSVEALNKGKDSGTGLSIEKMKVVSAELVKEMNSKWNTSTGPGESTKGISLKNSVNRKSSSNTPKIQSKKCDPYSNNKNINKTKARKNRVGKLSSFSNAACVGPSDGYLLSSLSDNDNDKQSTYLRQQSTINGYRREIEPDGEVSIEHLSRSPSHQSNDLSVDGLDYEKISMEDISSTTDIYRIPSLSNTNPCHEFNDS